MLREFTKTLLNNPDGLRVSKDSESDRNLYKPSINKYVIKDNNLKEAFNKMIDTVSKVNDERILSLYKFFELENYMPQVSRTTKRKNPLVAIIMNVSPIDTVLLIISYFRITTFQTEHKTWYCNHETNKINC